MVVTVYTGGGKDPLKADSYRGITLTSCVAKVPCAGETTDGIH